MGVAESNGEGRSGKERDGEGRRGKERVGERCTPRRQDSIVCEAVLRARYAGSGHGRIARRGRSNQLGDGNDAMAIMTTPMATTIHMSDIIYLAPGAAPRAAAPQSSLFGRPPRPVASPPPRRTSATLFSSGRGCAKGVGEAASTPD